MAEAKRAGADEWLVGGDLVAFGPQPQDTLDRLRGLERATWIRGNADRWLLETPIDNPSFIWRALDETRRRLDWESIEWLYSLPSRAELDGVLYVHGSPLSDCDSFAPEEQPEDERRLAQVRDRTVVFGHSHRQFGPRAGPNGTSLVNPGSVGQPLDGDPRASFALRHDDGTFEQLRVEYDHRSAAETMRAHGDWAAPFAERIERAAA